MENRVVPPSTITTARLHLIRLTDTSPSSQHVRWFHENWSDPIATGWSLHGATKTLEESRVWMEEHMEKHDNWFYAVFLRKSGSSDGTEKDARPEELGEHIGSVSLRHQAAGPTLLPPRDFDGAAEKDLEAVTLNLRVIGYALFENFHGKGYVTEACRALIDGYAEEIGKWKASEDGKRGDGKEVVFYLEGGVDQDNLGSQKVLRKLGFKTVGMKVEKEKAWLNGGWRGPGWWITGMYL
ncbi:hypothetical protein BU25DRAFT_389798 [Macroventuria anomochaeta]|uniref:Uncharacterized protein n=1 Tax=Macroventuria anomochaeta TaxID=301207 RepID=A0ACB6S5V6_9PLEO|nr:uncharacterized protein BU25DRAFT_389798 [Macroventuria anomochaeta]KAF2628902.1 hypothetical protein BU25DRAFT_389798 [Macroventuria anomochaeta]